MITSGKQKGLIPALIFLEALLDIKDCVLDEKESFIYFMLYVCQVKNLEEKKQKALQFIEGLSEERLTES